MRIASGVTDQFVYFLATLAGAPVTGLATWTVYRSRNGAAAAAMTTPTINETDSTNMKGVYELLLDEDMTIGAGNDTEAMVFHITEADCDPIVKEIELYRIKITAGSTLGIESDGDVTKCNLVATTTTNTDLVTAAAVVNEWETQSQADPTGFHVNILEALGVAWGSGAITAASIGANAITEAKIADNAFANEHFADNCLTTTEGDWEQAGVAPTEAEINAQVDTALSDIHLDHLFATSVADEIVDNSAWADLVSTTGDWSTFSKTTDSLQSIRDALTTAQNDLDTITGTSGVLIGTDAANVTEISDAVWDEDATAHQNAGTFGLAIGDPAASSETIWKSLHTDATGDAISDDIKALKAETVLILEDTAAMDTIVAKIPLSDGTISWNATALAAINTEVDGALDTAISELGVAEPTATPTVRTAIMLMYMAMRNKLVVQTSGTDALEIYNTAGTIICKKLLTDDGSDYIEAKTVTG